MPIEIKPVATFTQRERHWQVKALLTENDVPSPYIIWLQGRALSPFLSSIGKEPFFKDGRIIPDQLYRFNLETGRYKKAEPYDPARARQ